MSVRSLPLQIVITVRLGAHHSVLVLQILLLDLVLTYYFEYCIIRSIISFARKLLNFLQETYEKNTFFPHFPTGETEAERD